MPPKKSVGGKNKKATAAELEQQRIAEASRLMQEFKERELEEVKMGKLNYIQVQSKWKEIMRQVKTKDLRKELEMLENLYHHQLDQKEAAAQTLAQNLEIANDQHNMVMSSYLENLQTLLDFTQRRADMMSSIYERDLAVVNGEFNAERSFIQVQHAKEKARMLDILHRMEYEFLEAETDAKHEFSSFRDDVKNKNLEEKHALRIQLEGIVEDLWRQFQAALVQYNASTEERKKQFEELKEKDFLTAKEIEVQIRKLARLQESISQLKQKLHVRARDFEERLRAVREEKEANHEQFQELKRQMNADRAEDHEQIAQLAVSSNNALKKLAAKKELAEKLLRLAEMNGKLEAEHEKVIFDSLGKGTDGLLERELEEAQKEHEKRIKAEGSLDATSFQMPDEVASLEHFQKRFNKVLLDKIALSKQKQDLLAENQILRNVLREYLDGVAVNEQVLAQRNTLLIVNGKSTVPIKLLNSAAKQQNGKVLATSKTATNVKAASRNTQTRVAIPN